MHASSNGPGARCVDSAIDSCARFSHSQPERGRDRQVLRALRSTRLPGGFVHIVLGPGCDGETSVDAMRAAVRSADERGALLGVLPRLGGSLPAMAQLAAGLSPNRTPNILARAIGRADSAEGTEAAAWEQTQLCTITRHGHTEQVPWAWLTVGIALRGDVEV